VPLRISVQSGFAKNADKTYARSARVSHLKALAMRRYEPPNLNNQNAERDRDDQRRDGTGRSKFIARRGSNVHAGVDRVGDHKTSNHRVEQPRDSACAAHCQTAAADHADLCADELNGPHHRKREQCSPERGESNSPPACA